MNRLESIKERLKVVENNPYVYDFVKGECYSEDVTYLLQRLERYESALKGVVEQSNKNNCNWCGDSVKVIAEEALKE